MIYRVKQFFQGMFARITKEDRRFISKYLNQDEQVLFFKLRRSEQYHSLKVAKACFGDMPKNNSLVRAALLHDIGKVGSNLNLINKSLVVLALKFKLRKHSLPQFLQKAVHYKEEHPRIGCELLASYKLSEYEYLLIKNHHAVNQEQLEEMKILQYYDNKY